MKRKLWIYGCSYSDYWASEQKEDRHNHAWPALIAKELDLSLNHWDDWPELMNDEHTRYRWSNSTIQDNDIITWKAVAGDGFSLHKDIILEDWKLWKPQDIVIIEESVRQRAYTPYLKEQQEEDETPQSSLLSEEVIPISEDRVNSPMELHGCPNGQRLGWKSPENRTIVESNSKSHYCQHRSSIQYAYNNDNQLKSLSLYRELVSWKHFYNIITTICTYRKNNTFVWNYEGNDLGGNYVDTKSLTDYSKPLYRKGNWELPHWKDYKEICNENILSFPMGKESMREWMGTSKDLFNNFEECDDHQNNLAHRLQANHFIEQIRNKMK